MRYERKYRIETLPAEWVIQSIRLHPASFKTAFPDRQINNIYFDTPDLQAFNENVMGVQNRTKYRLRWYGQDMETLHKPVFEAKIKDGELGYKKSQALPDSSWDQLGSLFKDITTLHYSAAQPVLVNSYQRSYYLSQDGRFRITVDRQLQYAPFRASTAPKRFYPAATPAVIVEIKYEQADDQLAQAIFDHFPFRQTKNSKFTEGMNTIL